MNTRIQIRESTPRHLDALDKEILRIDVCLAEKPSPAIKATLEQERENLVRERSLLMAGVAAVREVEHRPH